MQTRSQTKLFQSKSLNIIHTRTTIYSKTTSPQSSSPITRSQTKQNGPVFDFDESSTAWLNNKTKLGNGTYSYTTSKWLADNTLTTKSRGITTRSGLVLSA
jgi:hypothetical protein